MKADTVQGRGMIFAKYVGLAPVWTGLHRFFQPIVNNRVGKLLDAGERVLNQPFISNKRSLVKRQICRLWSLTDHLG